jgi:cytochrome P450
MSIMATATRQVTSDIDLWTDSALLDPFANYRTLRELGAAVWLNKYSVFAIPRFLGVRSALRQWESFSSAYGVGMNEETNRLNRGSLLTSDGAEHVSLRRIIGQPLKPKAMVQLRAQITAEAAAVAARVVSMGEVDGVADVARQLPLAVVRNLVGLPERGRERMLDWGTAGFNAGGPDNERSRAGRALRQEMLEYMRTTAVPGKLLPDSWGAQLYAAAERGELPVERCAREMSNYVGPSLDTTINATTSALWLFAEHPEQWDALCANPALIPNAVQEVLRLESPVQFFTRYTAHHAQLQEAMIPADSRVLIMYGSANRDERRWHDPERFDILRDASEQLAFGHGAHVCLGMPLARLEIETLLLELTKQVKRFTVTSPARAINNSLRGFERLPLSVTPRTVSVNS